MATFADLHPRPHDAAEPDIRWRTSRTDLQRLQRLTPVIGSQAVSDSPAATSAESFPSWPTPPPASPGAQSATPT